MEYEFLTLSGLKERGWTDSIIIKMNLLPDKLAKNPHYIKASPMKLYFITSGVRRVTNTLSFRSGMK
jgi:hypothetical protein